MVFAGFFATGRQSEALTDWYFVSFEVTHPLTLPLGGLGLPNNMEDGDAATAAAVVALILMNSRRVSRRILASIIRNIVILYLFLESAPDNRLLVPYIKFHFPCQQLPH